MEILPVIFFLIFLPSTVVSQINLTCPSPEVISPCVCLDLLPLFSVECSHVVIPTVISALDVPEIYWPLPSLKIFDTLFFHLPERSFERLFVEKLEIINNNIRYISDEAFVGSEYLGSLSLVNGRLTEVPTQALTALPHLTALSLAGNHLSMLRKNSFLPLKNLKYLILSDNHISVVEYGAFPSNIVTLTLSNNNLRTLNESVRGLQQLKWLHVTGNNLTSVQGELEELPNLQLLNLAGNSLMYLGDSFNVNFHLDTLNLSNNLLYELQKDDFANLTRLKTLDVSGNQIMTIGDSLLPLEQLVFLNMSGNNLLTIRVRQFATLRNLRELDLAFNQLTLMDGSFGYPPLQLQVLFLDHNQLQSFHGFTRHLPLLEVLDVSYNEFNSFLWRDFENMPLLEHLDITGNPLSCEYSVMYSLKRNGVEIYGLPVQCG